MTFTLQPKNQEVIKTYMFIIHEISIGVESEPTQFGASDSSKQAISVCVCTSTHVWKPTYQGNNGDFMQPFTYPHLTYKIFSFFNADLSDTFFSRNLIPELDEGLLWLHYTLLDMAES
jgi:hypothetical protein